MATISREMTEEEFLSLPDDDQVERELIRGELRERPMTTRAYAYCIVVTNVGGILRDWSRRSPGPHGSVVSGEARIRLRTNPPTFVGVDVAYISPESRPARPRKAGYVDGPLVLVVEVLSPSDSVEDVDEKILEYLEAGVALVWVINPRLSTVTVYQAGSPPRMFSGDQEITAETHLPGFRAPVSEFFEGLED